MYPDIDQYIKRRRVTGQARVSSGPGSRTWNCLVARWALRQLAVGEDLIEKTAFRCHLGHYEFLRMPFGLTNAPAVFQSIMDKVLMGLIGHIVMVI